MGFAFVEAGLGAALQRGLADPAEDEERALDAADLAQRQCEFVLRGVGAELLEKLARSHGSHDGGGSDPEDIRPVPRDPLRLDPRGDHWTEGQMCRRRIEGIETLRREVADARREGEAEDGTERENVVGEPAGVGVVLADPATGIVHQQAVKDVERLGRCGRDGLHGERRELVGDMTVGLDPGLDSVLGAREVHRLSSAAGGEELPV